MRRSAAITVLAVTLGLLPACTPEPEDALTPTPDVSSTAPEPAPTVIDTPTTAAPEPSPSPSPSETLDADQQAARDLVIEFYRVQDELAMDSTADDLTPLMSITTGDAQLLTVGTIQNYREDNQVHSDVVLVEILSVSSATIDGAGKLVSVDVCTDASGVEIIDLDTDETVSSEDRQPVLNRTIDVVNENGIWLVSAWRSTPVEAC